jgi:hypothetical protein
MKKIVLLTFLFISFLNSFAQNGNYIPFPSKMIVYKEIQYGINSENHYYTNRFEIQGDTLLNGLHYSKWLTSTTEKEGSAKLITKLFGGIRNDIATKKVYAYFFDTNKEELLYDFDLHIGDTLFKNKNYTFYRSLFSGQYWNGGPGIIDTVWVSHIDSILMPHDGLYHKRFNFQTKFKHYNQTNLISSDKISVFKDDHGYDVSIKINPLVEGVGLNFDNITLFTPFEVYYESMIICRSIGGKKIEIFSNMGGAPFLSEIYCDPITVGIDEEQKKAAITLYPNPSAGKFKLITNNLEPDFFEITNLLGVNLLHSAILNNETEIELPYPTGIYFIRVYDKKGQSITKKIIID